MTILVSPIPVTHEFKISPTLYAQVACGRKSFIIAEIPERGFHVGETCAIRASVMGHIAHDIPAIVRLIVFVQGPGSCDVPNGHAVLSLAEPFEVSTLERTTRAVVRSCIVQAYGPEVLYGDRFRDERLECLVDILVRSLHSEQPANQTQRFRVLKQMIDMFGPLPKEYAEALRAPQEQSE